MTVAIRNWKKFQHFKDRRPPWIKLYRDLLDDPDWHEMSGDDAKTLVMLWMIASEDEGRLPDTRKLAFRLRISNSKAEQLVNRLSKWLIQDDIKPTSGRYQDDAPETEGETETQEEGETELRAVAKATRPDPFEDFWKIYPKRDGANPKAPARKKYLAALKAGASSEDILAATKRFAEEARSKGQIGTPYVPQAITWLNQQRWGDYPPLRVIVSGPPQPPDPSMPSDAELRAFYAKKRAGLERNPALGPSGVLPEGDGDDGGVLRHQAGNGRV
jgi:hypothetical protein